MAAKNEMTITVRAIDAATAVFKRIGAAVGGITSGMGGLITRFFSFKSLIGGLTLVGLTRAFTHLTQSLAKNATQFDAVFSPERQAQIDKVVTAMSRLGATLKSTLGNVISTFGDDIASALDAISTWIQNNQGTIARFFFNIAQSVQRQAASFVIIKSWFTELSAGEASFAFKTLNKSLEELEAEAAAVEMQIERLGTTFVRAKAPAMEFADFYTEAMERAAAATAKLNNRLDAIAHIMTDSFLDGVDAMIDRTKKFGAAFEDMVSSMLRSIARMLANEALFSLFRVLIGAIVGVFSGGGSSYTSASSGVGSPGYIGSLPGALGGTAAGGPAMGGSPHRVGENGPETFVPSTSGYIQRGGGSGDTFNINIVEAKDARATAQAVMAEIERNRGFRQRLQLA